MSMSPLSLSPGDDKLQKSKSIDGCLYLFFSEKKICKETIILMFVCNTVLYKYMKSLENDVNIVFDNKHERIKTYLEFYHAIIYIANEGCHVRICYICKQLY